MVDPLQNLAISTDVYGGAVKLTWTKPATPQPNTKVYLFKKALSAPSDAEIIAYFNGTLDDQALAEAGLFVFRNLADSQDSISDLRVENDKQYFYKGLIFNTTTQERSTAISVNATPSSQHLSIRVVDGKQLVSRGVEKVIDAIKSVSGIKLQVGTNIKVFHSHSQQKDEDFFVVVTRSTGQTALTTMSDIIAEMGAEQMRGGIDIDVFQVEWVSIGNPARRDRFTDLMRVMRILMNRYIMQMGNGDVLGVKFIMNGDSEGAYKGAAALKGAMTVALVVEQKLEIKSAKTTGLDTIVDTIY